MISRGTVSYRKAVSYTHLLAALTSADELDLQSLGEKKVALFALESLSGISANRDRKSVV